MAEHGAQQEPNPKVIVVDDDDDLLMSISRLLERNQYDVLSFNSPQQLFQQMPCDAPDCVLTDVMMDDMDGFALAKHVHDMFPSTALIFMTAWPNVTDAVSSFQTYNGVNYLQKPMKPDMIISAVERAVAWSRPRAAAVKIMNQLSTREQEVLSLLSRGYSNKQIAYQIDLSQKTIEYHRASMLRKVGSSDLPSLYQLIRLMEDM